jgi:hypothetical protein
MTDADHQPEGDPRPWEQPGQYRRDCTPHRGRLLRGLGDAWGVCGMLSFCLLVPGLLAVALGAAVWALGRRDLEAMRRGRMDPRGITQAEDALDGARWGTGLAVGSWAFLGGAVLVHVLVKLGLGL